MLYNHKQSVVVSGSYGLSNRILTASRCRRTRHALMAGFCMTRESGWNMTKEEYSEYLKSDHWQEVRQKRIEIDKHRCYLCNKAMGLNVHHLRYDNLGREVVGKDLVTLCYKCHKMLHRIIDGSKKEYTNFKMKHRYNLNSKEEESALNSLEHRVKCLIDEEFWLRDSSFGGDLSIFGDRMKTVNRMIKIVKIVYPDIGELDISKDIKNRFKIADSHLSSQIYNKKKKKRKKRRNNHAKIH